MLKALLMSLAVLAGATSLANAGGLALTVAACPNNPGALGGSASIADCFPPACGPPDHGGISFSGPSVLDCASGQPLVVLATWEPNESIPDLSNLDGTLQLYAPGNIVGPSLDQTPFWNFDPAGCNTSALSSSQLRPATGCGAPSYVNTWGVASSGTAIGAGQYTSTGGRIVFTCYRPSGLAVSAGQRLFGVQIIVDGSTALEAGGTCAGCCSSGGVGLQWVEGRPGSFGALNPTSVTGTFVADGSATDAIGLFPTPGSCASVPVHRPTWGRLKSLYR